VLSANIISAYVTLFNLTSHTNVLISRAKTTYALSRLDAARAYINERAACYLPKGPTRSRTIDSFDCKAMRGLI
jgi:hypothetical protein